MQAGQNRVAIIGLGYIGLPTAAVIARAGMDVVGVDVSPHVVDTINAGRIHIEEQDLDALVHAMVESGRLRAALAPEPADVFMIAVPTPFLADRSPDLSYVMAATRAIAPVLQPGNLVVLESTSPVGTTEQMRDLLAELRPDLRVPGTAVGAADLAIAYCPERVLPGRILAELISNDRVVGGITPACAEVAQHFYQRFVEGQCIPSTSSVAEMTKLAENAFRDVNIAFANELSLIADRLDIDVWEVIRLANRHPRVNILQPGPGVGGHCIAVDPWFLAHSAPDETPLIRAARGVNDGKVDHVVTRVRTLIEQNPGPVACLGLAFKANIDDFRESPAMAVVERLAAVAGDRIQVCEPFAQELPAKLSDAGVVQVSLEEALRDCAVVVLLVDHDQFRAVPADVLAGKAVYDTRGIWPQVR